MLEGEVRRLGFGISRRIEHRIVIAGFRCCFRRSVAGKGKNSGSSPAGKKIQRFCKRLLAFVYFCTSGLLCMLSRIKNMRCLALNIAS